jgi:polar amino acid transport system substrate-binding protein
MTHAWGLLRAAATSLVALLALGLPAQGRPLADITQRGEISLCANPDALPYASDKPQSPGFQVELARALAQRLGVKLQVLWIIPRLRAGLVDCDMLLDTIVDPSTQRGPIRLSQPYQKSGVALALRSGVAPAQRFDDVPKGTRVGVMVNSLASRSLDQRGLRTVPYAFENEMVADLAKGELDAAAVSPASIAYFIQQHPEAGLRYTHAYESEPELRWNLAVGLRRSDDALVDAVNAALAQLGSDGTLEKIYGRYGVELRRP